MCQTQFCQYAQIAYFKYLKGVVKLVLSTMCIDISHIVLFNNQYCLCLKTLSLFNSFQTLILIEPLPSFVTEHIVWDTDYTMKWTVTEFNVMSPGTVRALCETENLCLCTSAHCMLHIVIWAYRFLVCKYTVNIMCLSIFLLSFVHLSACRSGTALLWSDSNHDPNFPCKWSSIPGLWA